MNTKEKAIESMEARLVSLESAIANGNMRNAKRDAAVCTSNALISFAGAIEIFTLGETMKWLERITAATNYAILRQSPVDETPSWMQDLPVEMD